LILSKQGKGDQKKQFSLFHKETNRYIIPVLMNYPPSLTQKTKNLSEKLKSNHQLTIIGPHQSTLTNKAIVMKDLEFVSIITTIIITLLVIFAVVSKKSRILLLFPPVMLSIFFSAMLTILFWGSIHGLTLSLGSGIIGLSLDYGFHALIIQNKSKAWRSNTIGLITTVIVLINLAFSDIPLVQQMMFFSIFGLFLSFLMFYFVTFFSKDYGENLKLQLSFLPRLAQKTKIIIFSVILLGIIVNAITTKIDLSLKQFDYQTQTEKNTRNWLFRYTQKRAPLFLIHEEENIKKSLTKSNDEKTWSKKKNITYEGLSNYIVSQEERVHNFKSWHHKICSSEFKNFLSMNYVKIFSPFLNNIDCQKQEEHTVLQSNPTYTSHLISGTKTLSFWFPENEEQEKDIKSQWPQSQSLYELVSLFPQILFKELSILVPLSLLMVFAITFLYYRNLKITLKTQIPFLTGMGLVSWGLILFDMNINFISIIAALIVYGLSIDYGVFSCDSLTANSNRINSALTLSALTTISGFLPLVFCKHPVLLNLGFVLTLGTIGALLGSLLLIPKASEVSK